MCRSAIQSKDDERDAEGPRQDKSLTSKDTPRHQRSRHRREFHVRIFDTLLYETRGGGLNFGMHHTVRVARNSRMLTKHLPVRVTFSPAATSSET